MEKCFELINMGCGVFYVGNGICIGRWCPH